MPVHAFTGCGGRKRFLPLVSAPYRIPLNTLTPPETMPRIFPSAVCTIGKSDASSAPAVNHADAASAPAPSSKPRRPIMFPPHAFAVCADFGVTLGGTAKPSTRRALKRRAGCDGAGEALLAGLRQVDAVGIVRRLADVGPAIEHRQP